MQVLSNNQGTVLRWFRSRITGERRIGYDKEEKPTKAEHCEVRLRKARQLALAYEGTHIARAYRKRFKVDPACAIRNLEEIGVLSPEKLVKMKEGEQTRLEQKRKERERKKEQEFHERFSDSDDTFFFIPGYTSGSAPYGTTWEEMRLEPCEIPEDYDYSLGNDLGSAKAEHLLGCGQGRALFEYLENLLKTEECDNTLKHTYEWLRNQGINNVDDVIEEIKQMGGY